MVLAWVFSCGELVKTARWRPFVIGSFSASCVMGWTVLGSVCRAGLMASAGRCACLYRLALPLPLGAGDYVRPAGVGSACGEGVGDIVEVLLSRGSPSFYFAALVVIVSPCLLRRLPVSFSSSPPASCASFLPPASVPVLRSRVVSYRSSPRSCDEPGGAIFACLPHPFSVLALSSRAPPLRCLSRLVSPCLLAPRGSFLIVLFVPPFSSHAAACPCLFAFARVSLPPVRLVSPSCDKRGRGAYRLVLACLSLSSGAFSSRGRLAVSAG